MRGSLPKSLANLVVETMHWLNETKGNVMFTIIIRLVAGTIFLYSIMLWIFIPARQNAVSQTSFSYTLYHHLQLSGGETFGWFLSLDELLVNLYAYSSPQLSELTRNPLHFHFFINLEKQNKEKIKKLEEDVSVLKKELEELKKNQEKMDKISFLDSSSLNSENEVLDSRVYALGYLPEIKPVEFQSMFISSDELISGSSVIGSSTTINYLYETPQDNSINTILLVTTIISLLAVILTFTKELISTLNKTK